MALAAEFGTVGLDDESVDHLKGNVYGAGHKDNSSIRCEPGRRGGSVSDNYWITSGYLDILKTCVTVEIGPAEDYAEQNQTGTFAVAWA